MSTSSRALSLLPVASRGGRKPSSISQALRAISASEVQDSTAESPEYGLDRAAYRISVASDRFLRERAYRLAQQVYQRSGYLVFTQSELCVADYDVRLDTLTLLARDRNGRDLATLSVVLDIPHSRLGLPCDEIYHSEVQTLRRQGHRLAEFTRLAMAEGLEDPKAVLQSLFMFGFIFARCLHQATDLLIEVNPRHEVYYRRMLLFQSVGPARACPRVNGAPAVLLRMECSRIEAIHGAGFRNGRGPQGRRLHPYFTKEEEQSISEFLLRQHRPMTQEELQYFGLAEVNAALVGGSEALVGSAPFFPLPPEERGTRFRS